MPKCLSLQETSDWKVGTQEMVLYWLMTNYTLEFTPKPVSSHSWKRCKQTFCKVCLNLTQMYSYFPLATHPNGTALISTCSLFTAVSSFNLNCLTKQFMVRYLWCDMPSVNIWRFVIQYSSIDYSICWRWFSICIKRHYKAGIRRTD